MSEEAYMRGWYDHEEENPPLTGEVVHLPAEYLALCKVIDVLRDEWATEARSRLRSANQTEHLFGPQQMIYAAEASVLQACSDELARVLHVALHGEEPPDPEALQAIAEDPDASL